MCIIMLNKNLFLFSHSYNFFKYKGFYHLTEHITYDYLTLQSFIIYPCYFYIKYYTQAINETTNISYWQTRNKAITRFIERCYLRKFTQKIFSPLCTPILIHDYIILRHLWCKSYKGKCHVSGKPVSGQNNWSNGWSSYKTNTTIRAFLKKQKKKRHKIRAFKNKVTVTRKLKMQVIQKPVKKKPVKKKPVKKKKFDVWS